MSPWFTRKSGTLGSQGLTGSTTTRGGKRRPTSRRADQSLASEIGEDRFGRNRVSPGGPGRWLRKLVGFIQFMLLAVLLICAGYQSHYIFFKALYFRIQEITVEGQQALESQEVVALSGISLGDLFFKYNYERVKDRVRRHPRVKDVRVVVKSPNSIKLQIEEKEPRFYLQHGEEQLEIDEDGVVLGPREHTETLPLVKGAELADTRPGEDAEGLIAAELEAELRLPDPDDPPLVSQPSAPETTGEAEPPMPSPPTPQLRVRHRRILAEWVPALAKSPLKEYEAIDVSNPHEIVVDWKDMKFLVSRVDRFLEASDLIQPVLLEAQNKGLEVTRLDLRFPNPILKVKPKPVPTPAPTPEGEPPVAAVPAESPGNVPAETPVQATVDPALPGEPLPVAPGAEDIPASIEAMDEAAFEKLEVPAGEEPVEPEQPEQDLESFFGQQARPASPEPERGGMLDERPTPAGWDGMEGRIPTGQPDPWPVQDVPGGFPGGDR